MAMDTEEMKRESYRVNGGFPVIAGMLRDAADEITRLRAELEEAQKGEGFHPCCRASDCLDSVDGKHCHCSGCTEKIEAEARAEKAEAERDQWAAAIQEVAPIPEPNTQRTTVAALLEGWGKLLAERDEALARVERLQEAVTRLLHHDTHLPTVAEEQDREFARALLAETEEDQTSEDLAAEQRVHEWLMTEGIEVALASKRDAESKGSEG